MNYYDASTNEGCSEDRQCCLTKRSVLGILLSACASLPPLSMRMSNKSSICWLVAVGT